MNEQIQTSTAAASASTTITATTTSPTQPLWEVLTAGHNLPLYGLADGAANAYIHAHLQVHHVPHLALYTDKGLPQEQSPWLFPLRQQETFSEWYLQESPAQYWGILLATPLPLVELAEHLRDYLTMQDEQGKLHLMRFYDPRVIKAYLDALSDEQRQGFFKPGIQLWADAPGQAQTLLHYQEDNSQEGNSQPNHSQEDNSHYRRTPIDLRTKAQAPEDVQSCGEGDCAC
ncbi:MAG: DUF4123 domain-containing protein [Gammaproteobacteria bacterium]|nr:DUF4123 domain-containing protein [Gammaproteobacteria bacterium]